MIDDMPWPGFLLLLITSWSKQQQHGACCILGALPHSNYDLKIKNKQIALIVAIEH